MHKEESRFYSKKHEYKVLYRCSQGDWICINVVLSTFFFQSLSLSLCLSLFPPFSILPPFLVYFYLPHIFMIHFYLTSLFFWHLLFFTSEASGRRDLLSCNLYYSGHFLINAVDKTVVYHLMRMQQATLGQKLPYYLLTSTLFKF